MKVYHKEVVEKKEGKVKFGIPLIYMMSCHQCDTYEVVETLKKPNLTSLFSTHYITENVGQKLSQKTSEIHKFIMPCTKCKVERRKRETERKNILERKKENKK